MALPVGVQSFTYRNFSNEEIRDELVETGVEAIELCGVHVGPDDTDDQVTHIRELYDNAGIDICGYGVHDFEVADDVEPVLGFAAEKLGVDYVSIHVEPDQRAVIDELCEVAESFDLLLGVHNHGPGHFHDTVDDVKAVFENTPLLLGACVDTGHFLRSDITSEEAISAIGNRVHAVHLKDFVDEETEVIPGDGRLDVRETLSVLDEHTEFHQPLVIEYEEDADDPTPAVNTIVDRVESAQRSLAGE